MFERLSLLVDAARGLKYLHSKDIIHGDLVSMGSSSMPICCAHCATTLLPGMWALACGTWTAVLRVS
jgi:hypothetical protein